LIPHSKPNENPDLFQIAPTATEHELMESISTTAEKTKDIANFQLMIEGQSMA
jgi:hypothetical protein